MTDRLDDGRFKKACSKCGVIQSLSMYYASPGKLDGKDSRCKTCEKHRRKVTYHADFIGETLTRIRNRSKYKDIEFNLTRTDIPELPTHCPILGLELGINWGGKAQASNSPTLDRVNPELGYVKGNIAWISARANTYKQDNTLDTLHKLKVYMEGFKDVWK